MASSETTPNLPGGHGDEDRSAKAAPATKPTRPTSPEPKPRKRTRTRSALMFLTLVLVVALVITGVILFQRWQAGRNAADPKDVAITATVRDEHGKEVAKQDVHPYKVCEVGAKCPEGDLANLKIAPNQTLHLEVPKDVYDHNWAVVNIYDDPAVNSQHNFKAQESNSFDIPGSVEPTSPGKPRPKLVVAEVSTLLIGKNNEGAETPYSTVWSVHSEGTSVPAQ